MSQSAKIMTANPMQGSTCQQPKQPTQVKSSQSLCSHKATMPPRCSEKPGGCSTSSTRLKRSILFYLRFYCTQVSELHFDCESNVCRRLYRITHQVLRRWGTASTGAWVFGSMMEVQHTGAIQGLKQAVRCNHTAEGFRLG
jgi:hypothetical protein